MRLWALNHDIIGLNPHEGSNLPPLLSLRVMDSVSNPSEEMKREVPRAM